MEDTIEELEWEEDKPKEKPKPKKESKTKTKKLDSNLKKLQDARKIEEDYLDNTPGIVDTVLFMVRGSKRHRFYVLKNINLTDQNEIEDMVIDAIKGIRAERKDKTSPEEDQETSLLLEKNAGRVQDAEMIKRSVIYPPEFSEWYDQGIIPPGDAANLLLAATGLAGYFPPINEPAKETIDQIPTIADDLDAEVITNPTDEEVTQAQE